MQSLSAREKGLGIIYIIRDLKRQYPARSKFYITEEAAVKDEYKLSDNEIKQYWLEKTEQDLQYYCKDNKYFTYYIPGTTKITPELDIILKYLTASDAERKKLRRSVIDMTVTIAKNHMRSGMDSPAYVKDCEFSSLIDKFPDIDKLVRLEKNKAYGGD